MRAAARLALLCALSLTLGCDPAPLDGKACPCAAGYTCCAPEMICLGPGQICVGAGKWPVSIVPGTPVPIDDATVFAFSHVDTNASVGKTVDDDQLAALAPDMVIRAWAQWGPYGLGVDQYQFDYIDRCHAAGIRYFMGGATATVLLEDETTDRAGFEDFATRNAAGELVPHDDIHPGMYRASLANPRYRQFLLEKVGHVQIDGGVDGIHFAEINDGYQGADRRGNEGFDDYHLADFNAYLLSIYPPGTDFVRTFGMAADNVPRHDVLAGDLARNFRYRDYLAGRGWRDTPLVDTNPLAALWGKTTLNRPTPGAGSFVNAAEPYRYWKQIVDDLRAYARARGREILISGEGIYPHVDFQSVGLDDFNTDGPDGMSVDYMPTTSDQKHLRGNVSLKNAFLGLRATSEAFAPGAPVVLFLDGRWDRYQLFPQGGSDRADFWRIYAAEAYANGLFFAFHLKSSVGEPPEPTAADLGLLPLFQTLAGFYRAHAGFYHGAIPAPAAATTSLPSAMVTVTDQPARARRLVHVVNHEYEPGVGIKPQHDVLVTVAADAAPASVVLASPDLPADLPLPASFADGRVTVTLPALEAYDVVVISY